MWILSCSRSGIQFPDQGSNPGPVHWKCGVLASGPPGKYPKPSLMKITASYLWGLHDLAPTHLSSLPFCLLHHTQANLAFLLLRFTSLISVLGNLFLLFLLPEICVSRFLSDCHLTDRYQLRCHSCSVTTLATAGVDCGLTEWSGLWYSRVENLRLRYTPRMLSRVWL